MRTPVSTLTVDISVNLTWLMSTLFKKAYKTQYTETLTSIDTQNIHRRALKQQELNDFFHQWLYIQGMSERERIMTRNITLIVPEYIYSYTMYVCSLYIQIVCEKDRGRGESRERGRKRESATLE